MDLLFTKNSRMTTYAELYYYTGQVGNISFVIKNYQFFCELVTPNQSSISLYQILVQLLSNNNIFFN